MFKISKKYKKSLVKNDCRILQAKPQQNVKTNKKWVNFILYHRFNTKQRT